MKRKQQGPQARSVRPRPNLPPRNVQINARQFSLKPHVAKCSSHLPFRQGPVGTCWFVSVLAVFFLSELMRGLVIDSLPQMKGWKVPIAHHIADFFLGNEYAMSDISFLTFLRSQRPNVFNGRQDGKLGGNAIVYLSRFLNFFEIPHLFYVQEIGSTIAYASKWNLHLPFDPDLRKSQEKSGRSTLSPFVGGPAQVIVIQTMHGSKAYKNRQTLKHQNLPQNARNLYPLEIGGLCANKHTLNIKRGGVTTYRLDAILFSNTNKSQCQKGHATAGVTCNGQRYFYQGWPNWYGASCPLHPFEWSRRQQFTINWGQCSPQNTKKTNTTKDLVFDTFDNTIAIYVRV